MTIKAAAPKTMPDNKFSFAVNNMLSSDQDGLLTKRQMDKKSPNTSWCDNTIQQNVYTKPLFLNYVYA